MVDEPWRECAAAAWRRCELADAERQTLAKPARSRSFSVDRRIVMRTDRGETEHLLRYRLVARRRSVEGDSVD